MKKQGSTFKVAVLGEMNVGKTSFTKQLTRGIFPEISRTTIGVHPVTTAANVDGETVTFEVLDTPGCWKFRRLIQSYLRIVDAVILMYDISDKETFACLPAWSALLSDCGRQNVVKLLVGNKKDLAHKNREVRYKNAKNFAEFENMVAIEISSKQAESVDLTLQCIARELKFKKIANDATKIVSKVKDCGPKTKPAAKQQSIRRLSCNFNALCSRNERSSADKPVANPTSV